MGTPVCKQSTQRCWKFHYAREACKRTRRSRGELPYDTASRAYGKYSHALNFSFTEAEQPKFFIN